MLRTHDDLFEPGVWRATLEKYAAVTRLSVHVYSADGRLAAPWAAGNPLEELFAEANHAPTLFVECAKRCLEPPAEKVIVHEASYGLAVVGAPLTLDGVSVGAAVAGYVLVDFTHVYGMRRLAGEVGVPFERLWRVARQLAPVPNDRLMLHGELLQALGDSLLRENRRTRQLEASNAAKDEFLAVLAHELRNPLAALSNALEIAVRTRDEAVMTQGQAMMGRQVKHLARLVDDLVDVSRLTRGKLKLQKRRTQLGPIVHSALEDTREAADKAGHTLISSLPAEPIWLDADAVRVAQVLGNLLSNAVKYTPAGGRIELAAACAQNGALAGVRICVCDNGVGIPPDKLESVFAMFEQLDRSIEAGYRGLGIGLSLVRSLVELHGGTIEARSQGPDKGSEFVVWLPISPAGEASEKPEGASKECSAATPKRRVLIVEDNRDAAQSLATLVRMLGHRTRMAFDGQEAIDAAEKFRPDLVLLDIGLPKLNGYEVARRLRAAAWASHVAIVAVTGWGQESDRQRSREAGCDVHLTKPLQLTALEGLLRATPPRPDRRGPARTEARPGAEPHMKSAN